MAPRWKHAPDHSHWGEFGPDDQRGRMNLVTPAKVLQGIAEVKEGRTFCLSLPLDVPGGQAMNPRRMPPRRYAVLHDGRSAGQQGFCWSYASEDADGDGVAEAVFYNDFRGGEHIVPASADTAAAAPFARYPAPEAKAPRTHPALQSADAVWAVVGRPLRIDAARIDGSSGQRLIAWRHELSG